MSQLFVAEVNDTFWLRVEGSASLRDSPAAKKCLLHAVESGKQGLVVDLDACSSMDSSFIGMLTGIARELARRDDGRRLEVVNIGRRCLGSLQELGIDHLLEVDLDGTSRADERALVARSLEERPVVRDDLDKSELAGHSLEAHETLQEANPENACRFSDVVDYLRRKTEAEQEGEE